METILQFVPILLSAAAGLIGIFSKKSWREFTKFDYSLFAVIVTSTAVASFLLFGKLQGQAEAERLQYATGIVVQDKFQHAVLVFGISDDSIDELSAKEVSATPNQHLFPYFEMDGVISSLKLNVFGLLDMQFEILQCNGIIRVVEKGGAEPKSYYTSNYESYTTNEYQICPDSQKGEEFFELKRETWTYDQVAGGAGHVIDLNTGESAGKILDLLTRADSFGELTIRDSFSNDAYKNYVSKVIRTEVKLYQKTDRKNILGEDCTSVYLIPIALEPQRLHERDLAYKIVPKNEGKFIRCEISPI